MNGSTLFRITFALGFSWALSQAAAAQCQPFPLGSLDSITPPTDIHRTGDTVFMSRFQDVAIIDVSSPWAPVEIGSYPFANIRSIVAAPDGRTYAVDSTGLLRIFSSFDAQLAQVEGSLDLGPDASAIALAVEGGRAYMTYSDSFGRRLAIVDVADPAQPSILATYIIPGSAESVVPHGDLVFASYGFGVHVIDVSDPSSPTLAQDIPIPANRMHLANDVLYLGAGNGMGLTALDVSDPLAPTQLDSLPESDMDSIRSMEVHDGVLYASQGWQGWSAVDVTDPTALKILGNYQAGSSLKQLRFAGDVAYVCSHQDGLLVFDISVCPRATQYCPAPNANSAGLFGETIGTGAGLASANTFGLRAQSLPPDRFGYFIGGPSQVMIPNAGGSQGTLCVGLPISRFLEFAASSGPDGTVSVLLDLMDVPSTVGIHQIVAGDAWNFQFWYRDLNPMPTSNFTSAVAIRFW